MEIKLFLITIGMIMIVSAFALGVMIGGMDKRKHNKHRNSNIHNNVAGGDDRGNNRHDHLFEKEITELADKLGLEIGGQNGTI